MIFYNLKKMKNEKKKLKKNKKLLKNTRSYEKVSKIPFSRLKNEKNESKIFKNIKRS